MEPDTCVPCPKQSSEFDESPMADQPWRALVPAMFRDGSYRNWVWVFLIPYKTHAHQHSTRIACCM